MNRLPLAYSTVSFPDHRLDDAARLLNEIGYDSIGLRIHRRDLDARKTKRLSRRLAAIHRCASQKLLVIEADGRYLLDCRDAEAGSLVDRDEEVRKRREQLIANVLRATSDVSAIVSITTGKLPAESSMEEGLERFAISYDRLARLGRRYGTRIAVRPALGQMISRITHFERLMQWTSSNRIWLAPDVGTMVRGGELPVSSLLDRPGLKIACVFVADVSSQETLDVPPGEGELHWPALLGSLKAIPPAKPFRESGDHAPICVRYEAFRNQPVTVATKVFDLLDRVRQDSR
jgi:sugar phosphate isomerase/epimerase